MKKLLFLVVVGFGGAMLVKGGHVTITPDNQVKVIGWAVPIPAAVQSSPLMGMVNLMIQSNLQPPAAGAPGAATAQAGAAPGRAVAPALPVITSAARTYNPNPSTAPATPAGTGPAAMGDQFSAVAKALRPQ